MVSGLHGYMKLQSDQKRPGVQMPIVHAQPPQMRVPSMWQLALAHLVSCPRSKSKGLITRPQDVPDGLVGGHVTH